MNEAQVFDFMQLIKRFPSVVGEVKYSIQSFISLKCGLHIHVKGLQLDVHRLIELLHFVREQQKSPLFKEG